MNKAALLPIVRHVLQIVAGILIARGVIDNDAAAQAVDYSVEAAGGILSLVALLWMVKSKKSAPPAGPTLAAILFAGLLGLVGTGCSSIAPGSDPVIVNAERTTALALESFDTFVRWEFENREALAAIPEIRKVADRLRADGQAWLLTARNLTKSYKANRTEENKANLETILSIIKTAAKEAQDYLLKTN